MYTRSQRAVAVVLGAACHFAFAVAIGAMVASLYGGLQLGRGTLTGLAAPLVDVLLLLQFPLLHSFLLTSRGRSWLARLTPLGLGAELATTTYALIASLQLAVAFGAWSPSGTVWWEPHGTARALVIVAYAGSWLLLLGTMRDAGLSIQTGFLGWSAVARNRAPVYGDFPVRGTFRYVRQPVYVAFALTLWTGPVWTPDRLAVALAWTTYCVLGPRWKERRYLRAYGARFRRYQALVRYWIPGIRPLDPSLLGLPGT